ncbi:MAG: helix-turn-helix transcriptional regulator [Eubacteriales bacterium]
MITLRGLVLSKYKTISEFGEAVGWKRNKASRIVNGIQDPNSEEIQEIVKCLDIDSEHVFVQIFFAQLSTLWISPRGE